MKIEQPPISIPTSVVATWLRPGAVVQGTITQLHNQQEADVEIQGANYRVQVEGRLPKQGNRITLKIEGETEQGVLQARLLPSAGKNTSSPLTTYLAKLGIIEPTAALRQVVALYGEYGAYPSGEEVAALQEILQSGGETAPKLETLQVMAEKQIPITPQSYAAVDQVLHGEGMGELVQQVEQELQIQLPSNGLSREQIQQVRMALDGFQRESLTPQQLLQLVQQVFGGESGLSLDQESWSLLHELLSKQSYVQQDPQLLELLQRLDTLLQTAFVQPGEQLELSQPLQKLVARVEGRLEARILQSGQPVREESLLSLLQLLGQWEEGLSSWQADGRAPDLAGWKAQLKQVTARPEFQGEGDVKALQETLNRALLYQLMGKEEQAPVILQESLQQIKGALLAEVGMGASALTGEPFQDAEPIVTSLKERMQALHFSFRQFQTQLQQRVAQLQTLVQGGKQHQEGILNLLDATIRQLDRQILSSEFATFSTLESEKQLMKLSSQLTQVRHEVVGGRMEQGMRLLQQLARQVQKLNWQPSPLQAERFLQAQQRQASQLLGSQEELCQALQQLRAQQGQLLGARDTQQWIRLLGLQHEGDVARHLRNGLGREPVSASLKSALLTWMQQGDQSQASRLLDKLSLHLLGQQLINKGDPTLFQQSYQLQLPIWEGEKWDTLQLHLRSHRGQGTVDWENCSLYFFLEHPTFGPTGIHLQVVNRYLSLTFQSDHPETPVRIERELAPFVEHLTELGYQMSQVEYEKLPEQREGGAQKETMAKDDGGRAQRSLSEFLPQQVGRVEVDIKI